MRLGSFHFLFVAVVAAVAWTGAAARADDDAASRKYPLLAAYIYNFTQFTTWPAAAIKDNFSVCVVGQNPFGAALDPIKNRTVQGKKIAVRHFSHEEPALASCNILYVAPSERGNVKPILAALNGAPVLTMSELDGFSGMGGMVEFTPAGGRIGISVDLSAVKPAGLSISSKLLSLANVKG